MNARAIVVACCLAAQLLTGCSALRPPGAAVETWTRPGAPQPRSETESLLAYFEYVRRIAPAEQAKELEVARNAYTAARTDFSRVRYAIAAGMPGGNDDARALEALGPLLKNQDAPLHAVAYLVAAQIQEQRRAQGMHEKLDALKLLERQMIERDPATSTRRQ